MTFLEKSKGFTNRLNMINDIRMTCLALELTGPQRPLQNKLECQDCWTLNDKQGTQ
jgi:hypothetical protein